MSVTPEAAVILKGHNHIASSRFHYSTSKGGLLIIEDVNVSICPKLLKMIIRPILPKDLFKITRLPVMSFMSIITRSIKNKNENENHNCENPQIDY